MLAVHTCRLRESEPNTMSDKRNLATPISISVAVIAVAWAIYASQHRAPAAAGPAQGGGARTAAPAFVSIAPVRSERLSQKLEALGNARANESVDISSKTSNVVTSIMFRDGERVKRGQVLVQLDYAQALADVAGGRSGAGRKRANLQPQPGTHVDRGPVEGAVRPARSHAQGQSGASSAPPTPGWKTP